MDKKRLEKKLIFLLKNKVSFFFFQRDTFIVFTFKGLRQKYVKIPNFIDSVQFVKKSGTFLIGCEINYRLKLERFVSFLLHYQKSFERPFRKKLVLKGLGFKVNLGAIESHIELKLGFSHLKTLFVPKDVFTRINKQSINLEGFNKVSVGNFASTIRRLKLPDSYKGKGVWYQNEIRILKDLKKK
jgi:hypothetical protein